MAAYDIRIAQRDPTNSGFIQRDLPIPPGSANALLMVNGGSTLPQLGLLGTGLEWDNTAGAWNVNNVPESAITNLTTDLAGKEATIPLGTSAQYYRGDKTWQTLPTAVARSVNSTPSAKTIQTVASAANGFQVSSTRDALVTYSATIVSTATIAGNASGYIALEIAATNSTTASDWKEVGRITNGQAVSLAIVLQSVSTGGGSVSGIVPAGYYVRLRSVNVAGTPSYTYNSGQEVLL